MIWMMQVIESRWLSKEIEGAVPVFNSLESSPVLRPPKILSRKNHPSRGGVPAHPARGQTAFSASQRRQTIARSFNCGLAFPKHLKPQRGDRKRDGNMRVSFCRPFGTFSIFALHPRLKPWAIIGRPFGTRFILSVEPAVETAGYCHPSLRDFRSTVSFCPPNG
jgi:hypothetical protein